MSRLTRDGTAEPVSRDHILRRKREQGLNIFPVQLTTSRIGDLTRLIVLLLDLELAIAIARAIDRGTCLNAMKRFCICSL